MKIIYIDDNYMCHIINDGTMKEIQTDIFDDLCDNSIELMRFVPQNEIWIKPNGQKIYGEFVQAINSEKIDAYQQQWQIDQETMVDMQTALEILGVNP